SEMSPVSGKKWVRYDDTKPQTLQVPLYDEVVPRVSVTLPQGGYLVPPEHAVWVAEKLKLHGLRFTVVSQPRPGAPVETMLLEPSFRPQPYEGRHAVSAKGTWSAGVTDIVKCSLFVPAAQPHIALVAHLFEPASPDSFVSWGFFNAHFEQKEYLEDYLTEAYARELLTDGGVKAEFEAKLKDEAFAKNPDARLRFFSSRHPSADPRLNRYPIVRTAQRAWK
ncbi:MAG: peptidase M14, partial [Archangium sp.]|nr:peptidase M14 [Archangium sp.]